MNPDSLNELLKVLESRVESTNTLVDAYRDRTLTAPEYLRDYWKFENELTEVQNDLQAYTDAVKTIENLLDKYAV